MVFVTVGNAIQNFDRLLKAVDSLAADGLLAPDTVFMQTGHSNFEPRHCSYQKFVKMEEFEQRMQQAKLIICHGGCTQLQAVRLGKIPVVMPRRKKYGEHVNDHQVQLVEALAAEGQIVPAFESEDLASAITMARQMSLSAAPASSPMLNLVSQAVRELTAGFKG